MSRIIGLATVAALVIAPITASAQTKQVTPPPTPGQSEYAPGKKQTTSTKTAKELAPGQRQKSEPGTAKDFAPGQQPKSKKP